MFNNLNWDDLKFFLVVCRTGSIRSAAKTLAVNHATVSRRINQFEKAVGQRLFDRSRTGYTRTRFADLIYEEAHHLEERLNNFSRQISADNQDLVGDIKVTLPQLLGEITLMPIFAAFSKIHPQIEIELLASSELYNLNNREADVALRICKEPPDHLIGRKLASLHRACYVTKNWQHHLKDNEWLAKQNWLGWTERMRRPIGKIAREYPRLNSKHKMLDGHLQVKACELGMGVAILPCFVGDSNPKLIRIPPYTTEAKYDLWLLMHPDLRKHTKIQQFVRYLTEQIGLLNPLFEGKKPQGSE